MGLDGIRRERERERGSVNSDAKHISAWNLVYNFAEARLQHLRLFQPSWRGKLHRQIAQATERNGI